jgi:hypothetical protein
MEHERGNDAHLLIAVLDESETPRFPSVRPQFVKEKVQILYFTILREHSE